MDSILITGGCGFVGSNLAILFKQKYPNYQIICFDNLKRRGSELNIPRLKENSIKFIHGDIRNKEDFTLLPEVSCVIDAAAEPSVLAGLDGNLEYLINSNLMGTINTLDFAHKCHSSFIFLSTSRIYPISELNGIKCSETDSRFSINPLQEINGVSEKGISESFPLHGARSFYGATKLASELFIQEYAELLNLKAVINRCGIITGPFQFGKVDQGVIIHWLLSHLWKKDLSYFGYNGSGKQVRDILYINDLFDLLDLQIHHINTYQNNIFNVGGGNQNSVSLKELTVYCQNISGNKVEINPVHNTNKADIRLYITDNSTIKSISNWQPTTSIENILSNAFQWILKYEKQLKISYN
jgi:CDP-paratose 2-epimerase